LLKQRYGARDSNSQRFANGLRDVLGNPVGIDLGFFIIRLRSGRDFEIRDEPALGRRFAENAHTIATAPGAAISIEDMAWPMVRMSLYLQ
jgi:hypothetical protein